MRIEQAFEVDDDIDVVVDDTPDYVPSAKEKLRGRGPVLGTSHGKPFRVDMEKLMATRLFIQAASGGGKSYALRRLLEQTHNKVQQIVIDPEGELVTLGEKYNFVVCSPESETAPINVHRADELASRIYRSGQSAILSIGNFDVEEMQEFVANFLRGLMREPKEHWHYCMVAIDEAQLFAPQQDKAESKKPMLDLAARARKRGICPVIATQRISQLHKGVAAHLDNKCIGLTTLDTDIERAADQLGMKQSKAASILRRLRAGEFMVYGPALTYDIAKITVGPVHTRHGALGKFDPKKPKPTLTRRALMKEMRALAPTLDSASQTAEQNPTMSLPDMIAHMRLWVINPLLQDESRGAVATRARDLGLSYAEVYTWLKEFHIAGEAGVLRPLRIRKEMIVDLRRLSPGWKPLYQVGVQRGQANSMPQEL